MILGGRLDNEPDMIDLANDVIVDFKVNTDQFVEQITRAARVLTRLDVEMELHGLTAAQIDAMMFVRGSSHEYAEPDERDEYLRALLGHSSLGHVAAAAFLAGWFTFRTDDGPAPSQVTWHRLLGETPVGVSAA